MWLTRRAIEEDTSPGGEESSEDLGVFDWHHYSFLEECLGFFQPHDIIPSDTRAFLQYFPRDDSCQGFQIHVVTKVGQWSYNTVIG